MALSLLTVLELWTEMLDTGNQIDAVYLDFRKAFDSVRHQRLHAKVAAYGFNGKVLDWIQAFLTDRKQRVVVNSCLSAWLEMRSGIPQVAFWSPYCLSPLSMTYPIWYATEHIYLLITQKSIGNPLREWLGRTASGSPTTCWVVWELATAVQCRQVQCPLSREE